MRIRLAKLKKGCFWKFVANEDDKEDKTIKKEKKAEPEEQPKKVKDKEMEEEDDGVLQIKPMHKAPRSTMLEKEDDADDEDQKEDKNTVAITSTGSSSSSLPSRGSDSSSTGTDSPLLWADEAVVRLKQEKAAGKMKKPHFKVEGRALGLVVGPTRMEKFRNDKRFCDTLELLEDFL